jgi:hypothetical protein
VSLFANWEAYSGPVALVTITAPGADVLPWDESRCTHPAGVPCSGRNGCQLEADALEAWNAAAPANWTKLHRAVSQRCRRRGQKLRLLGYVWQLQKRGALHLHLVVGLGTPAAMNAARQYQLALAERAGDYGFGYVDRKWSSARGQRVAAYLSSYLVTGRGRESAVQAVVQSEQAPARVAYMARFLTQATGLTMRQLRRRRFLWHQYQRRALCVDGGHLVNVETGEIVAPATVLKL